MADSATELFSSETIRFAHAVNSSKCLYEALDSPSINIFEADVIMSPTGGAIMGHDPGGTSDLEFSAFAVAAHGARRGIKIDIKMWDAVQLVVDAVREIEASIVRVSSLYSIGHPLIQA
jgi:hypothetical protein